jgi:hypothetical protein
MPQWTRPPLLGCLGAALERLHDGRTSFGLGGNHARAPAVDQPHRFQLLECFPHADEADTAAGRIDDHVRE